MVLYFKVKKRNESEPCLTERITNRLMDNTKTGLEDILGDNSEVPMKFRNWYKVQEIEITNKSANFTTLVI
jgi:hypothetical protein